MYFYFIQLPNEEDYARKVSSKDSDLSPEFLSQFKREADVNKTITHRLQNSNLNSQFTPNFQASSF